MERLDMCFVNDGWINQYSNAIVDHLPRTYSDHNPLLIRLNPKFNTLDIRPFHLETMGCSHSHFINLVENCWRNRLFEDAIKII